MAGCTTTSTELLRTSYDRIARQRDDSCPKNPGFEKLSTHTFQTILEVEAAAEDWQTADSRTNERVVISRSARCWSLLVTDRTAVPMAGGGSDTCQAVAGPRSCARGTGDDDAKLRRQAEWLCIGLKLETRDHRHRLFGEHESRWAFLAARSVGWTYAIKLFSVFFFWCTMLCSYVRSRSKANTPCLRVFFLLIQGKREEFSWSVAERWVVLGFVSI